jgi:MerR family copper efflux transcriptional regulator
MVCAPQQQHVPNTGMGILKTPSKCCTPCSQVEGQGASGAGDSHSRLTVMLIGEVARRTSILTGTIRFYERQALISPATRSDGGYRQYTTKTVHEIEFIKTAKSIGFSLDEIKDILALGRGGMMPCARVVGACETHLQEIERRIAELRTFRRRFRKTLQLAQAGCGYTPQGFCRAIAGGATSDRLKPAKGL